MRSRAPEKSHPPSPHPPIPPDAVYTTVAAAAALGISVHALRREVWLGRIRHSKRLGRYFYLGRWLSDWLGEGVLKAPRKRRPSPGEEAA